MSAPLLEYPVRAVGTVTRVMQWGMEGPLVLLLHGLGSHAGVWRAVAARLAQHDRRVVAVDLPGHGLTTKGSAFDYGLDGHVHWLDALLDALLEPGGEGAVHLVGSSLGGLWAAGFATQRPRRIRTLTLIGALGLAPLELERRRWTASYLERMDRSSVASRLRNAVLDPRIIEEALIEEGFRMNNSPGAADAFAALGRYYLGRINEDVQLERLAARAAPWPLLLLWGAADSIVPADAARNAAARIPGSTLRLLEGAGHIPHLECPGQVVTALAALIEGRS
ncbi:MAG TPA: alpha/beta fold hydrolase [Steroidobacteraceae bacterium]|nr:alpha/beta fold hydrolase [Steroidobacteraceae bacterium]